MTTLPTHLHQFLSAFVPWCEAHGGADYAEISATIAALGVQLTPEQVEAIGHTPPPGEPLYRPAEQVPSRTADDISPPPAPGQAFVVEPNEAPPVRYAKSGLASRVFPSIPRVLETVAKRIPNVLAHRVEPPGVPAAEAGKVEWLTWTWEQYAAEMKAVAKSLIAIGMNSFESVAICGFNHPCWFFMHVGALAANGLSAGTYPTNSAEACAFIAQDARCRVAAVDTVANMRKYLAMKDELPLLKHVVIWGSEGVPADVKAAHGDFVITYDEFKALGNRVTDDEYQARTNLVEAKNCAILIYTSGTTGTPKGVMASHDNMLIASLGTISWLRWPKEVKENHMVSFLPLSHIAAQVLDFGIPLAFGLEGFDITVTSARPDALKGTLGATLVAVRPTFFFGVPRVYEKFVEGIKAKGAAAASTTPKTIRQLTGFGAEVGVAAARAMSTDGDGKMPFGYEVVKKAVHAKVLAALGLDRAVVTLTGAAPITRQTLEFMAGMGVVIHEVFGMSETSGMGSCSTFQYFAFGSCGVVQHPYEMKIEHVPGRDKEGEGEICLRGRNIMLGYLRNHEKTRETIGDDGWLHSGDQGRIDERGRVYITGRIKELIIGAGGENIAPVPIETKLKELLPALSNAVLIGDQRKYNTLLVTLKTQPDLDTGFFKDNLVLEAAAVNPEVKTVAEAQRDATWTAYIEKGIKTYNEQFAVSNAAKVQKFRILPTDLSLPGGELTSTLKLRRAILVEKYATLIDEMYAD